MKKFFIKSLTAGAVLFLLSYATLYLVVLLLPNVAEQYYDPMFSFEGIKGVLYLMHPFVLSFALAWFWQRFKGLFHGSFWQRGIEMGLTYGLIATLPSMWILFSAMSVSFVLVCSWLLYGVMQAIVVGILFARLSP
ncbi:MAG: hypothetical protein SFV52_10385 [Saprospiraceae bacterium]|nr:hypothetical protein [Saprospiraceae bacterium]